MKSTKEYRGQKTDANNILDMFDDAFTEFTSIISSKKTKTRALVQKQQKELAGGNNNQKEEVYTLRNNLLLLSRGEEVKRICGNIPLFNDMEIFSKMAGQALINNSELEHDLLLLRLINRKKSNEAYSALSVNQALKQILSKLNNEISQSGGKFLGDIMKGGAKYTIEDQQGLDIPIYQKINTQVNGREISLIIAASRNRIGIKPRDLNINELQKLYFRSAVNTKLQCILQIERDEIEVLKKSDNPDDLEESNQLIEHGISESGLVSTIDDLIFAFIRRIKKLESLLGLKDISEIPQKKIYSKNDYGAIKDKEGKEYAVFDIIEKKDYIWVDNNGSQCKKKRTIRYRILSKEIYDYLRNSTLRTKFFLEGNKTIVRNIEYLFIIQRLFLVYPIFVNIQPLQNSIDAIREMIKKGGNPNNTQIEIGKKNLRKRIPISSMIKKLLEKDLRDPDGDLIIHNISSFINKLSQNKGGGVLLGGDIIKLGQTNNIDTGDIIFSHQDNLNELTIEDIVMHNYEGLIMRALKKFIKNFSNNKSSIICSIIGDEFYIFIPNVLVKSNLNKMTDRGKIIFFKENIRYNLRNEKVGRPLECRLVDTTIAKQEGQNEERLDYILDKVTRVTNLLSVRKELKETLTKLKLEYDYSIEFGKDGGKNPFVKKIKKLLQFLKGFRITDSHGEAKIVIPTHHKLHLIELLEIDSTRKSLNKIIKGHMTFDLFSIVSCLDSFLAALHEYNNIIKGTRKETSDSVGTIVLD